MDRDLYQGMTGEDVRLVQDRLNFHLRRVTPLAVDGNFGPLTKQRAIHFQRVNGLKQDGIVGPKTRAALFEVDEVPLRLLTFPELKLSPFLPPGQQRGLGRLGIQPPRLIPPLQWPSGAPAPLPPPLFSRNLTLSGTGSVLYQPFTQATALDFTALIPPVKDPEDPVVASTRNLIKIVKGANFDKNIKSLILGEIKDPDAKPSIPKPGFDFKFKPKYSPLDPATASATGTAKYTFILLDKPGSPTPIIVLDAALGGRLQLDYTGKAESNYFKADFSWTFTSTLTFFFDRPDSR